ncbi:DNA polymerase III subunit delta [Microterricola pindariensis]|uniref:DNA-directed DNA polymerase n=1 Tax=Microterricola pindariensis TaxID=478010 RepID=A0ABX5AVK0_9MICO|nr:DNA polymerase III subunit delta [Microterricola pindariensis]PPL18686.1 DNA polymerase III subunit delta [Microterricola pindariensis]
MATRTTPARGKSTVAIPQLAWNQVRPAPVVLVSGTEGFLADRAIRRLRDFLKGEDPSMEVVDLDADSYAAGELLTVASPSLFMEPRFIRVNSVEKCTDAFITETLSYLEDPAENTYLVLRHNGGVRGKKLLDALRGGLGGGIEVVCAELKKDAEKYDFAVNEFKAGARRITPGALRALVGAFSDDLAELASACQQLMDDTSNEINESTVERYYGGRVESNAFKVADAALAGRRGDALVSLRHALDSGADPVPIVAAFAMKVRTMAKVAGNRASAAELGMAPWMLDRARKDLAGWNEDGLARAIEALAEADAGVKGASRDPVYAIERLIGVIAARGRL